MTILDTNVLSEALKLNPSRHVAAWLGSAAASNLFTTAITQAELLYGIECMPEGQRRTSLHMATVRILSTLFTDRILPFDTSAAQAYSRIAASRHAMGRPISEADAQIAAVAFSRGAILATRNVRDFEHCGIKVLNPWSAPLLK